MKMPIEPTAKMIRVAKRWQRQCQQIYALNGRGGGPSTTRWDKVIFDHEDTSHELAELFVDSLTLSGYLPVSKERAGGQS